MKKVFFVSRTDRIGDVILTIPVFTALRKAFPDSRIIAHVRSYTAPILKYHPDVSEIIIASEKPSLKEVLQLAKKIRQLQPDFAIIVHPCLAPILACRLARVPRIIGRASNLWQILLSDPVRQHRSRNEMHEVAYNLELAAKVGIQPFYCEPKVYLIQSEIDAGKTIIQRIFKDTRRPVVIHPGHGGSAYNLPLKQYIVLARIISEKFPVLITFGPQEGHYLAAFESEFPVFHSTGSIRDLASVIANSLAFVGGSTGPMHLARALQKPVIAFFPPVTSTTPKRWGPVGSPALVIQPPVSPCNGKCSECIKYPCMETIDFSCILSWLLSSFKSSV